MSTLDAREFGPNIWLVEELYRRYLEDPDAVGPAWREFFQDYRPRAAAEASPAAEAPPPTEVPPTTEAPTTTTAPGGPLTP